MSFSGECGTVVGIISLVFLPLFPDRLNAEDPDHFDPFTGYRISAYRAPVPDHAPGTKTVDLDGVRGLLEKGAVLIDVYPLSIYEIKANGQWIVPGEHLSLPGAIWLPTVGWGVIEPWAATYVAATLGSVTNADPDRPVVVFCQLDCWLSWNAAQRISRLGYRNVHWFPGGVDAWRDGGFPLETVAPFPVISKR